MCETTLANVNSLATCHALRTPHDSALAFDFPASPFPEGCTPFQLWSAPGAFRCPTPFHGKTCSGYTESIGQDFGVIDTEQPAADPTTTKPDIKLVLITGGKVQLQWKKLGLTGIRIEMDRGGVGGIETRTDDALRCGNVSAYSE